MQTKRVRDENKLGMWAQTAGGATGRLKEGVSQDGRSHRQTRLKLYRENGYMAVLTEMWMYVLAQVLVKAQVLPQQPLRLLARPVAHHLPPFRQGTHASEGDTRRPCDSANCFN